MWRTHQDILREAAITGAGRSMVGVFSRASTMSGAWFGAPPAKVRGGAALRDSGGAPRTDSGAWAASGELDVGRWLG
jgi:hypothetical protein